MVDFDKGRAVINYRVAGVALHNGRVLLDRNIKNEYWVLPGGHPEMMESMADALRREVLEEIGEEVKVVRLLWVLENFFHKNKDIHEISFYFLMQLRPDSTLLRRSGPYEGNEHGHKLIYDWFRVDELVLRELPLFPSILSGMLFDIPSYPQHLVFQDLLPDQERKKKIELNDKQIITPVNVTKSRT